MYNLYRRNKPTVISQSSERFSTSLMRLRRERTLLSLRWTSCGPRAATWGQRSVTASHMVQKHKPLNMLESGPAFRSRLLCLKVAQPINDNSSRNKRTKITSDKNVELFLWQDTCCHPANKNTCLCPFSERIWCRMKHKDEKSVSEAPLWKVSP